MADETANLILEHLRGIGAKQGDMAADLGELKQRMGLLEGQSAHPFGQDAILSNRVDRIDAGLERIERDWILSMRERVPQAPSLAG
jgi:hypothetical protein